MLSGFVKGLFTGGIIGALLSSSFSMTPQKKQMSVKRLKGKTKNLQSKATNMVKEVVKDVNDLLK